MSEDHESNYNYESGNDHDSDNQPRGSKNNNPDRDSDSGTHTLAPSIKYTIREFAAVIAVGRRQEALRLVFINSLPVVSGPIIPRGGDEIVVRIMPKTATDKAGVERSRPLYTVVNDDKKRVAYFYDSDIGNYAYVTGHPMKPHRIRLAHSLVMNYDVYKYLEIYVSRSHIVADDLLCSMCCTRVQLLMPFPPRSVLNPLSRQR